MPRQQLTEGVVYFWQESFRVRNGGTWRFQIQRGCRWVCQLFPRAIVNRLQRCRRLGSTCTEWQCRASPWFVASSDPRGHLFSISLAWGQCWVSGLRRFHHDLMCISCVVSGKSQNRQASPSVRQSSQIGCLLANKHTLECLLEVCHPENLHKLTLSLGYGPMFDKLSILEKVRV